MEIFLEPLAVALHRLVQIPHRPAREIGAEHRAAAVEGHGHLCRLCGAVHPGFELGAQFFELLVGQAVPNPPRRGADPAPCRQCFERRDARRHGQRVAAQRPGLINRSQRREPIHDVRPSPKCPDRQTAADDFAEARQIRLDAEPLLRPAGRKPEAGHHFVKNQQGAVRLRDFAQKLQVARLRQIQSRVARHRLDDDAGDFIFVRRERSLDRFDVIEWQNDGVLRERRRHPGAVGMAKRERAGTGLDEQ